MWWTSGIHTRGSHDSKKASAEWVNLESCSVGCWHSLWWHKQLRCSQWPPHGLCFPQLQLLPWLTNSASPPLDHRDQWLNSADFAPPAAPTRNESPPWPRISLENCSRRKSWCFLKVFSHLLPFDHEIQSNKALAYELKTTSQMFIRAPNMWICVWSVGFSATTIAVTHEHVEQLLMVVTQFLSIQLL